MTYEEIFCTLEINKNLFVYIEVLRCINKIFERYWINIFKKKY